MKKKKQGVSTQMRTIQIKEYKIYSETAQSSNRVCVCVCVSAKRRIFYELI